MKEEGQRPTKQELQEMLQQWERVLPTYDAPTAAIDLEEILRRVTCEQERVLVRRDGKPVAALISLEDLHLLEWIEDRVDAEEAEKHLTDPAEQPQPWEEVKARLGW
jgi:prevent-host-death family protein